jgi:hypothetical protein
MLVHEIDVLWVPTVFYHPFGKRLMLTPRVLGPFVVLVSWLFVQDEEGIEACEACVLA